MAVTHIAYSCLTMLLAIVKIHTWRVWEDQAYMDELDQCLTEINRESIMQRQSMFTATTRLHASNISTKNSFILWATCFFRQFGSSVFRSDYLALRKGFIMNHHLAPAYDFHNYMVRSMEEEFQRIVGVSWSSYILGILLFIQEVFSTFE